MINKLTLESHEKNLITFSHSTKLRFQIAFFCPTKSPKRYAANPYSFINQLIMAAIYPDRLSHCHGLLTSLKYDFSPFIPASKSLIHKMTSGWHQSQTFLHLAYRLPNLGSKLNFKHKLSPCIKMGLKNVFF